MDSSSEEELEIIERKKPNRLNWEQLTVIEFRERYVL
jgi:hypothetical protein